MLKIMRRTLIRLLLTAAIFTIPAHSRAQDSPSAPSKISAEKLNSYVGQFQYSDNPYLPISFTVADGKLYVESRRSPRFELVPSSQDNTFVPLNNAPPMIYKFMVDANGKVTGVTRITADKSERQATKISEQPLTFNKPLFSRLEVMIPVRDGIKLHAVILTPAGN